MGQARCLHELSLLHRRQHKSPPVLVFLDIKSAYDSVDRDIIWKNLADFISAPLLALLQNLFDEVSIEVLLSNTISRRFHPVTGVLQGSILSPFLWSVYIKSLPEFLHDTQKNLAPCGDDDFQPSIKMTIQGQLINCLLYADDVILIGTRESMPALLQACEQHCNLLGYRWNPKKCVVLYSGNTQSIPTSSTLYGNQLPRDTTFPYLGILFQVDGTIDTDRLIHRNTSSALSAMRILQSIGINSSGFSCLLSTRLYRQFIRQKLEYGLAITTCNGRQRKALDAAQSTCLRWIYGARERSSATVMAHMEKLPTIEERAIVLQAKFLLRSCHLPEDALPTRLISLAPRSRKNSWMQLKQDKTWKSIPQPQEHASSGVVKTAIQKFHQEAFESRRQARHSVLLQACRSTLTIDPLLYIPMSRLERSHCIR